MSHLQANHDRRRTSPQSGKSGKSSPWPSTSLSHVHIADALLRSPDNGITLDLSHRNLTDIDESGVEELATLGREDLMEGESCVERITLGHNHLTTLPMAYALLTRLRYINLKSNDLTVFPDVLTVMPSLEVLDIGKNKIKRLPSKPGSLLNLRVFSMSRNKLTRLPGYITQFQHLSVFQVDHNPIEWPPKDIMERGDGLEGSQAMKNWIRAIQKWIEENSPSSEGWTHSSELTDRGERTLNYASEEPYDARFRFPVPDHDFDAGLTPHARSFSIDSDTSISIYSEIDRALNSSTLLTNSTSLERLQRLHLDPSSPSTSSSTANSPSHSPDRYLPTPEESIASADEDITDLSQHARNASYASGTRKPLRPSLVTKKSLPDLRTAKVQFGVGKKDPNILERSWPDVSASSAFTSDFPIPSPISQRQDSSSSDGLASRSQMSRSFATGAVAASPTSLERAIPSMDVERNSYFRRLSTLPTSTISKTVPDSLLRLVDAVRGILFGVSQVYQTLQHYTVYAIDERLSSILMKVLDPASTYMAQLINALDRFDTMSRRTLPHPAVCRAVVESCKDNVAVFGKAVGVLALQLKVLATRDDVRYTRQMLLVLYGATAEIANAWGAMLPHIDAVEPLLRDHRPPLKSNASQASPLILPPTPRSPETPPASAPPTSSLFISPQPLLRSHSAQPSTKGLISRRHAGSFSSKDVEIGKKLPSYIEPLPRPAGIVNGEMPAPRSILRQVTTSASTSPTVLAIPQRQQMQPLASSSMIDPYATTSRSQDAHSRQTSQNSVLAGSNHPSPLVPRAPALETPTNSNTLVDKQAINAMNLAVEAAPAVWEMIDEILNDVGDQRVELQDSLTRAKAVTESLSHNIRAVQDGDSTADRKTLREDAHVFVKTVVQLSNVIKTYSAGHPHPVWANLRSNMVKLTSATEEFVMLLHVSSFSPSATPRPYSPMVNGSTGMGAPEDGRLGANLSRSRSVQPSASTKLPSTTRDIPRSALPHQAFKIPNLLRPGAVREEVNAGLGS